MAIASMPEYADHRFKYEPKTVTTTAFVDHVPDFRAEPGSALYEWRTIRPEQPLPDTRRFITGVNAGCVCFRNSPPRLTITQHLSVQLWRDGFPECAHTGVSRGIPMGHHWLRA